MGAKMKKRHRFGQYEEISNQDEDCTVSLLSKMKGHWHPILMSTGHVFIPMKISCPQVKKLIITVG